MTDPFRLLGRTRRHFFRDCGVGLGSIALSSLLAAEKPTPSADPLAPKTPHHKPKAKSIIYLFMAGGPSQLEFFDHKPKLAEMHGQGMPESFTKGQQLAQLQGQKLTCFGPQHKFAKFGRNQIEICELFPQLGSVIDDVCLIRSMTTDAINHDLNGLDRPHRCTQRIIQPMVNPVVLLEAQTNACKPLRTKSVE